MDDKQLIKAIERDDSYRVVRVLGQGPSGTTELVKGAGPELLVRKRIPNELANVRAWQTLATINSPLLPQVRDLYQLPDQFVAITTYVEGITLSELVSSTGPLASTEAMNYMIDLCEAASLLHAYGIVHRDITPGNAVVSQGHARLIDLGNAREHAEGVPRDTTHLGTWGFAAPEQFGFAQTDARSDVYSLGGMLGYLLTGVQPGDESFEAALVQPSISPELRAVVAKARAFEPSARFQSAAELTSALKACASPFSANIAGRTFAYEQAEAPHGSYEQPPQSAPVGKSPLFRWLLPVPPGPRCTWSEMSLFGKAIIIAVWVVALFFATASIAAGCDSSAYTDAAYALSFPCLGITWGVCSCLLAREIQLCITSFVPGRNVADVLKLFLVRIVTLALLCLAFSVAIVIVAVLLSQPAG